MILDSPNREFYWAVREWSDKTRQALKPLISNPRIMSPQELKRPLGLMRQLMEMEVDLVRASQGAPDLNTLDWEDIELDLRGVRDTMARIVADSIVSGMATEGYMPEEYEITTGELENRDGIYIELPYDMISMSDLYRVRNKRLSSVSSLFTVRQAWIALIKKLVEKHHGSAPLRRAKIRVNIYTEHKLPLDPDHFWLRPVIDGLVETHLLVNDNADSVEIMLAYRMNRNQQFVRIEIEDGN